MTDFLFTILRKKEKNTHETLHIFETFHFENESAFRKRTTFWKWKLIPKPILWFCLVIPKCNTTMTIFSVIEDGCMIIIWSAEHGWELHPKPNQNITHKTFHILKMKAHFEREPHFENESSFWNPFWKLKHVLGKVKSN